MSSLCQGCMWQLFYTLPMVGFSCTASHETTAFCNLLLMNKLKFITNTRCVLCTVWSYKLDKLLLSLIIDYESVLIDVFIYKHDGMVHN